MGDPRGFLKTKREHTQYRPVCERIKDYERVFALHAEAVNMEQSSRCMDCGTPFCHSACPIGNVIPEWNDLTFRGHWKEAFELLRSTNNLPEITGRVCPALCEYACVLGINDDPVTIRENELGIIEHAFKKGLAAPRPARKRTGKKIAVIGSGPAGLSCADQLNFAGHKVTVFEKDDRIGGIMRYGIPDFKLEKSVLDRRIALLCQEGVEFRTKTPVPENYPVKKLLSDFDAVCLCGGCRSPRDLKIEGRELSGIYFAMDYLTQSNKRVAGDAVPAQELIDARDKKVLVIGGGDTGSDCVGTAHRQGASCVVQIEVLAKPPECRTKEMSWPRYPLLLKNTSSHEEGGERDWAVLTKKFRGKDGRVSAVDCVRLDFSRKDERGCPAMQEIPDSGFAIEADMVVLAIGFVQPERAGLLAELGCELDQRGNVKTDAGYRTSVNKVFSAGDMRRGQSLVVWAISEGRRCARSVDEFLMGRSFLPSV